MANYLCLFAILSFLQSVVADMCDYQLYPDNSQRTAYCSYGCCYTMIYPCCIEPFYVSAGFIAPMVIGSIGLFTVLVVVVIIIVRRRRMQPVPTVRYTTPAVGQQVMTTSGGVITYPGYGNTQYIAQPMYPGQPANGAMPMYTVQPVYGGNTPMYMMPAPNGAPPAYATQNAEATGPINSSQAAGGADPVPTKTPLQ